MNTQSPRFGKVDVYWANRSEELYLGMRRAHIASREFYNDTFDKMEKAGLDIIVGLGGNNDYAAVSLKDRVKNQIIGNGQPKIVSVDDTLPADQKYNLAGLGIYSAAFALGVHELAKRLP